VADSMGHVPKMLLFGNWSLIEKKYFSGNTSLAMPQSKNSSEIPVQRVCLNFAFCQNIMFCLFKRGVVSPQCFKSTLGAIANLLLLNVLGTSRANDKQRPKEQVICCRVHEEIQR